MKPSSDNSEPLNEEASKLDMLLDGNVFDALGMSGSEEQADESQKLPPNSGRYEFLRELGEGGNGRVYEARDSAANRSVAIKLLRLHRKSPKFVERETEALRRLSHPGIVSFRDFDELSDGTPFLVMELVEGITIDADVERNELAWRRIVEMATDICKAVEHAHSLGIMHCDLKPQNILVCPNGAIKITDFGLVRFLDEDGEPSRSANIRGTPAYMAPEQLKQSGEPAITVRTDVFGIGATLYRLLSGRSPRPGKSTWSAVAQIATEQPVKDLDWKHIGCPADLALVVQKAVANRPEDRYRSVAELRDELSRVLNLEPVSASRPRLAKRLVYWGRRQPVYASLLLVTAISVCMGIASLIYAWQSQKIYASRLSSVLYESLETIKSLDGAVAELDPGERLAGETRRKVLSDLSRFYHSAYKLDPQNLDAQYEYSQAEYNVGAYLHDGGKFREAVGRLEEARYHFLKLNSKQFKLQTVGFDLFQTFSRLSAGYHQLNRLEDRDAAVEHAFQFITDVFQRDSLNPEIRGAYAAAHVMKAENLQFRGEVEPQKALLNRAKELAEDTRQIPEAHPRTWRHKTQACRMLAYLLCNTEHIAQAKSEALEATDWARLVIDAADPSDENYWGYFADSAQAKHRLAAALFLSAAYKDALKQITEAELDLKRVEDLRPDTANSRWARAGLQTLKANIVAAMEE